MPRAKLFSRPESIGLTLLALVAFVVGLHGLFDFGYVGQDYEAHYRQIASFSAVYDYNLTDPPGYYWLGHVIREHVSPVHFLVWLAFVTLVLNTAALALVYRFLWQSITHHALRWASAALITFVPVRMIHSIVIAADALTLPIFVLITFFTIELRENPRRAFAWLGLSVSLSLGVMVKYTFGGLFAPLALVLASTVIQALPRNERRRWSAVAFASLALPGAILAYHVREINRVEGAMTHVQWLPPDAPSVMRWQDMLLAQPSDLELLSAPGYFEAPLFAFRKYSYPGLVFVSTFSDPLNLFQPTPPEIAQNWEDYKARGFFRERAESARHLQARAVSLSLPLFFLTIAGTLGCGVLGLAALLARHPALPGPAVVLTALAVGYYSPVFFGLHRIANPYGEGFWTPRLFLPAMVIFLGLGFVLLDLVVRRWNPIKIVSRLLTGSVLAWTFTTCALYLAFLL